MMNKKLIEKIEEQFLSSSYISEIKSFLTKELKDLSGIDGFDSVQLLSVDNYKFGSLNKVSFSDDQDVYDFSVDVDCSASRQSINHESDDGEDPYFKPEEVTVAFRFNYYYYVSNNGVETDFEYITHEQI